MPANLSQQYRNAEKKYRRASTLDEELACLELMLREIPKHKGTDKLQADLKKRISQTRTKLNEKTSRKSTSGFRIPRQGAGRVILVGPPNSGKSQLFNCLTGSTSKVADYPFATLDPQPALMNFDGVKVQLIDTPPVGNEGLDPRTESLIRGADLVLLLLSAGNDQGADQMLSTFQAIQSSQSRLGLENCIDETNVGVTYTRTKLVWTCADDSQFESRHSFFTEYLKEALPGHLFPGVTVSASSKAGIEHLKASVFGCLQLVRVYTKTPGQNQADLTDPVAMPADSTVLDLAGELHQELAENFHQARVWSESKHAGTIVTRDYVLQDQDIIEIRTR